MLFSLPGGTVGTDPTSLASGHGLSFRESMTFRHQEQFCDEKTGTAHCK